VATANLPAAESDLDPTPEQLRILVMRATEGDEKTLPALRALLTVPEVVERFGNLARHVDGMLSGKLAGKDLAVREGLAKKLETMRAELAGPTPAPLERLLVERIVTCWLHLHYLEVQCAGRESMALELATYYQRALSAAQKRYLSAIRTLAVVRKLAVPVLQVNIARKQVNVAGPAVP
jgi:hypothetical protein